MFVGIALRCKRMSAGGQAAASSTIPSGILRGMALKTLLRSEAVARYVNEIVIRETDLQKRLRAETSLLPQGGMQISADQGAMLSMLVKLIGAKSALEVGTFTGYSALCVASALPADGKLIACDVSEEWTSIARRYWLEAGVASKIGLRLAPALQTLEVLMREGRVFDFAFIDADKESYQAYYEAVLRLLRAGGLMVFDNALGTGGTGEPTYDPATSNLHALNVRIREDDQVESMLATVGAGFLLVRKK